MLGSAPAFAAPLNGAKWGVPAEYQTQTIGGVNQMLRYTFNPSATSDERFIHTIEVLQELTQKYVDHPEVVQFTRRLFNNRRVRNHDYLEEIQSIVTYFQGTHTTKTPEHQLGQPLLPGDKGSYRYQLDPYSVELFQSPPKVLRDIAAGESGADCDDIAAAAACCLAAAGHPVALMIVDADPTMPGSFNHVMLASKTLQPNEKFGDDWFAIELIHPFPMGASVPVTQFIPLLVMDYDRTPDVGNKIPGHFR